MTALIHDSQHMSATASTMTIGRSTGTDHAQPRAMK
jgi:hypothetical protein